MYLVIKRLIDVIISLFILLCFSPIIIVIFGLLLITNKGYYPLFLQERPGKNNEMFLIIKFKTMNDKIDINGNLFPDEHRLTPIGKLIRRTSLDEILQLVNVIKGDMSLVGPRPLLPEYLRLYNDFQKRRHEVKPGITGWAQVNGRNAITWQQKFKHDVWYVDNLSFLLDIKILLLTIKKVLKREGIGSGTSVTMERFVGN